MNGKRLSLALPLGIAMMVTLAGCTSTGHERNESPINWVGYEEGMQLAKQQGKPTIINFYSTWCSPCKKMDKTIFEDQQVVETSKQFVCIKVNIGDQKEIRSKYGINATPTTIFLDSSGNEMRNVLGGSNTDRFYQYMDELLDLEKALKRI